MSRLVYALLITGCAAMLMYLAGFGFFALGLASLTTLCYTLAGKLLMLTFGLFVLFSICSLLNGLRKDLVAYFSKEATALRRLLTVHQQTSAQSQLNKLKNRQLQYFSQFKRNHLLSVNNKKHLRELYVAIASELKAQRAQLSSHQYQELYQALRKHHKQADATAMLAIRERISCR